MNLWRPVGNRLNVGYVRRRLELGCERFHGILAQFGIRRDADDLALLALKKKYAGRRAFVIANGPSLRVEDLDRLWGHGEITLGANRVFVAFGDTPWRPAFYIATDWLMAERDAGAIRALDAVKLFPTELSRLLGRTGEAGVVGQHVYFRPYFARGKTPERYHPVPSADALRGFLVGRTVTTVNIQLAYWLGCDPIILVGLDGRYELPGRLTAHDRYGQVGVSGGEQNHFHPAYRREGDTWAVPRSDLQHREYEACRQFLNTQGVTILNASRESAVTAFPTVDLDRLLDASD